MTGGRSVGSDEERIARLWRMPLELLVQYATVTHAFVDLTVERWATGRYVPPECQPSWIAALSHDADLAAQVATDRGATGLG
jgi:hypothetical protein